jgi:hypothetical protein
VRVTVDLEWRSVGTVELGGDDSLRFPSMPVEPGIYRFAVSGRERSAVYIGEADNLKRRMQHYRTPGPTQPTNRRLNDELRRVLTADGRVDISIATNARLEIDGHHALANMRHKAHRVLAEHAALASAIEFGSDAVINLARETHP